MKEMQRSIDITPRLSQCKWCGGRPKWGTFPMKDGSLVSIYCEDCKIGTGMVSNEEMAKKLWEG